MGLTLRLVDDTGRDLEVAQFASGDTIHVRGNACTQPLFGWGPCVPNVGIATIHLVDSTGHVVPGGTHRPKIIDFGNFGADFTAPSEQGSYTVVAVVGRMQGQVPLYVGWPPGVVLSLSTDPDSGLVNETMMATATAMSEGSRLQGLYVTLKVYRGELGKYTKLIRETDGYTDLAGRHSIYFTPDTAGPHHVQASSTGLRTVTRSFDVKYPDTRVLPPYVVVLGTVVRPAPPLTVGTTTEALLAVTDPADGLPLVGQEVIDFRVYHEDGVVARSSGFTNSVGVFRLPFTPTEARTHYLYAYSFPNTALEPRSFEVVEEPVNGDGDGNGDDGDGEEPGVVGQLLSYVGLGLAALGLTYFLTKRR